MITFFNISFQSDGNGNWYPVINPENGSTENLPPVYLGNNQAYGAFFILGATTFMATSRSSGPGPIESDEYRNLRYGSSRADATLVPANLMTAGDKWSPSKEYCNERGQYSWFSENATKSEITQMKFYRP